MRPKAWLGMLLLSLLPVLANAQDQHEALVQELYGKSGLEKQMQEVPLSIQAGLDQLPITGNRLPKPPPKVIPLMKALAPEAFAPERLKAAILPELRAKLTNQDLKTVLRWLDSPLGIKCTRLEEDTSTPETYAESHKYAEKLEKSPQTAERLKVLRKFDAAVRATKHSVEIVINMQAALALGINASLPKEQQRPLADISREIEKQRPEIEAAMKMEMLVSQLYTYRSLTEAEIQQYIKFASSPAGLKYHAVADAALKKAFIEGGISWGKAIGEAMNRVKSQVEA